MLYESYELVLLTLLVFWHHISNLSFVGYLDRVENPQFCPLFQ